MTLQYISLLVKLLLDYLWNYSNFGWSVVGSPSIWFRRWPNLLKSVTLLILDGYKIQWMPWPNSYDILQQNLINEGNFCDFIAISVQVFSHQKLGVWNIKIFIEFEFLILHNLIKQISQFCDNAPLSRIAVRPYVNQETFIDTSLTCTKPSKKQGVAWHG